MRLREIMTANPILLKPEQSILQATEIFLENQVDGAPVVDKCNNLVGLFTKTHIYKAVSQGIDLETPVIYVMTASVITGHPDDDISDALHPGIGRLPVVDETGLIGIISRTDLARVLFESYQTISLELDTIINSTYNMIISVDEQGRINVFNHSAERILKIKAEEVKGKKVSEVFPDSSIMDIIKTGHVQPLQRTTLKGRHFISNRSPIKRNGDIIGAVSVLQDISEFEILSEKLKYAEDLNKELDAIIDSSFDGLYITDGNGITLRLNKAFEMIMGVKASEFLGRDVRDIEKEGIVSESVSKLVLEKKEPVTIMQETKTGKTVLATGNPVVDKHGNILRVVSNIRDLTELNMLKHKLEQAQGLSQLYESELKTLRLKYTSSANLVIKSVEMRNLVDKVIRLAQVDSNVLITGESGTGKELIAELIHKNSPRKSGPFIKLNCGAIPENLLESELFGYEPGAFTGARKTGKAGYFELAEGGTLFLDEIGDLPYNLQVKLLRVIQNREINRLGGEKSININVRILAATNSDLREKVRKKEFREDLYYRLNVVPVVIPPLRNRKEEIPALVVHFLLKFNRKYKLNKRISPEVVDFLMQYEWPGNVRELENLVEQLVVISAADVITERNLPVYIIGLKPESKEQVSVAAIIPLKDAVESVEKQLIKKAMVQYKTTRQMARALRVNASTVVRKAARYGIDLKAKK